MIYYDFPLRASESRFLDYRSRKAKRSEEGGLEDLIRQAAKPTVQSSELPAISVYHLSDLRGICCVSLLPPISHAAIGSIEKFCCIDSEGI